MTIRPARSKDVEAVRQIVRAAYGHYVAKLGKPPGPMLDDYGQHVADEKAWVLEDEGEPAGVLILENGDGGLLLDNVAVSPANLRGHAGGIRPVRIAVVRPIRQEPRSRTWHLEAHLA